MNKPLLKSLLKSKPTFIVKFCDKCGRDMYIGHPLVYCIKCPGIYKEYPKMTWKDCIEKDCNNYLELFIDLYFKKMDEIDPNQGLSKVGRRKDIEKYIKEQIND